MGLQWGRAPSHLGEDATRELVLGGDATRELVLQFYLLGLPGCLCSSACSEVWYFPTGSHHENHRSTEDLGWGRTFGDGLGQPPAPGCVLLGFE